MPRSGLPLIPHRHLTVARDARDRPVTVSLVGGAIERPSGVGTATRGGRVRPPFVVAGSRSRCRRRPVSGRAAEAGFERSVGEVVPDPGRVGSGGDPGRNGVGAQGGRRGKMSRSRCPRRSARRAPLEKLVAVHSPGPGAPVLDRHDPGHQSGHSATDAHHLTQHPPMPSAGLTQAHPLCRLGSRWLGVEDAGSAGRSYQRLQCTTSWKGRRSGLTSGRSGRSAG
jgi:hypothetical protein